MLANRSLPEETHLAALKRLIKLAKGDDGQAKLVANFLLAWWDGQALGSFDPTDMWGMDASTQDDVILVLCLIANLHQYPDAFGFGDDVRAVVKKWRPEISAKWVD